MFAEFLPFLLVFPRKHSSVGLTIFVCGIFLIFLLFTLPSFLGSLVSSGLSDLDYTCAGRGSYPLITHFSMVSSMLTWNSLIFLGELNFISV